MKTSVILTAVGYCLSAPGVSAPQIGRCALEAPHGAPHGAQVARGDSRGTWRGAPGRAAQEDGIGPPCLAAAPPRARPADPFWSPLAVALPQGPETRPDQLPLTQDVWTLGLGAASPAFGARLGLSLAPVQLADPRGGKRLALAIAPAGAPAALTHQLIHSLGAPPLRHRPGL